MHNNATRYVALDRDPVGLSQQTTGKLTSKN